MSRFNQVRIVVLLFTSILAIGCTNELVVETVEQKFPVVYGFLDAADSVQVIRVEAALLPAQQGGPQAYLLDSLRRNEVFFQVSITDVTLGQILPVTRTYWSDLVGASRPNVPFSEFVYTVSHGIQVNHNYQIAITSEQGRVASATTTAIESFQVTQPRASELLSLTRKIAVRWQTSSNAAIYEMAWLVQYQEAGSSGLDLKEIFLPQGSTQQISMSLDGTKFYEDLAGQLDIAPAGSRNLTGIYLVVVAGSADYLELKQVLQAGQGVTGIQTIPTYTNVEGGIGIFTSRYTQKAGPYTLTGESLDSLKNGQYTGELGF